MTAGTREECQEAIAGLIEVEQVDADISPTCHGTDNGPERLGRTAVASDDLAEVIGVHAHLEDPAIAQAASAHPDLVRVLDDAAHQMLERFLEHFRPRSWLQ